MADAVPRLRFLGHSTVLLELDELRIVTDPVLVDRLGPLHRHAGDAAGPLKGVAIDLVLISHGHHDHLHLPSLRRLEGRPRIVVPAGLGHLLAPVCDDVVEIAPGQRLVVGRLVVEAIRARHHGGRGPLGPTSEALGYRVAGRSRVYFAGDTDLFPEMSDLAGQVDAALLPVWGWGPRLGSGHLDPDRAAEAVARIRPRVAVPIHWGTFYPFALARLWPHPLGDPPRAFAREVARVAPETEVRILEPGEVTELPRA
ncbi:MAG: MBL fold metallo-hydrolase [Chloroflexi bacterium]|nr:MAG: MBL fold metallo-hydrolase [Chloroflexota bacterium]